MSPREIHASMRDNSSVVQAKTERVHSPERMARKRTFEDGNDEMFCIEDCHYGSIEAPEPLKTLIDTPAVQRLRYILQTGPAHFVYPCMTHSRFAHSLGTMQLAKERCESLLPRKSGTQFDKMIIMIAALLHDIGHGPFSHLFDNGFMAMVHKTGEPEFKHENMSRRIIEHCYEGNDELREKIGCYFNDRWTEAWTFIKEAITGEPLGRVVDGCRQMSRNEPWMYQIVSDKVCGLDVDRMDYIIRDSALSVAFRKTCSSILQSVEFNVKERRRYFMNSRIDEATGQLCYAQKLFAKTHSTLHKSRAKLHNCAYQHTKVACIELMCALTYNHRNNKKPNCRLTEAFIHANNSPHLRFGAQRYKLSEVYNDIEAYLKLDDGIVTMIKLLAWQHPDCPHLAASAKLLLRLNERDNMFHRIVEKEVPHGDAYYNLTESQLMALVSERVNDAELSRRLRVRICTIHFGSSDQDPIRDVPVYGHHKARESGAESTILHPRAVHLECDRSQVTKAAQVSKVGIPQSFITKKWVFILDVEKRTSPESQQLVQRAINAVQAALATFCTSS